MEIGKYYKSGLSPHPKSQPLNIYQYTCSYYYYFFNMEKEHLNQPPCLFTKGANCGEGWRMDKEAFFSFLKV